jgi:hypothetical protein
MFECITFNWKEKHNIRKEENYWHYKERKFVIHPIPRCFVHILRIILTRPLRR